MTTSLSSLRVKLYADGASLKDMAALRRKSYIKGFTTNPSLVRKLGARDYEKWCLEAVEAARGREISFEVVGADTFTEMARQAQKIASWGKNVYVKLPITNAQGQTSLPVASQLAADGAKLNITALLSSGQVLDAINAIRTHNGLILSVFAGRVADTGINAFGLMEWIAKGMRAMGLKNTKLLWASTREVYSIIEANQAGCDIITVPPDILAKAEKMLGYDLDKLSLETVQMFDKDAREAGYTL
jgi:transaldolase